MKVCTDACLFGAWIVNYLQSKELKLNHVLDIGSGTGLLSLMIAQNSTAQIEAVEIEESAAKQTFENFSNSPWANKLEIHNVDINKFSSNNKFDLILSNPPFYNKSLKSADESKNRALHDSGFSLEELVDFGKQNLSERGLFAILIPHFRVNEFENIVGNNNLFVKQTCSVRQTENHHLFRTMYILSKTLQNDLNIQELTIKKNGAYSTPFIELLKDYYLRF